MKSEYPDGSYRHDLRGGQLGSSGAAETSARDEQSSGRVGLGHWAQPTGEGGGHPGSRVPPSGGQGGPPIAPISAHAHSPLSHGGLHNRRVLHSRGDQRLREFVGHSEGCQSVGEAAGVRAGQVSGLAQET